MKVGQKVLCEGFLQRQKMKYIDFSCYTKDEDLSDELEWVQKYTQNDDIITQEKYKFKEKGFTGYIVGEKIIYTMLDFEWFEGEYKNDKQITPFNGVDCYKVAYRINGIHLVPKDKVVISND